jgi:hypothetical protein
MRALQVVGARRWGAGQTARARTHARMHANVHARTHARTSRSPQSRNHRRWGRGSGSSTSWAGWSRWPSASTGNSGPDLSSSWPSWRRRARTKRYLIPNRVVAKGVQLRLLRQRLVMTAQKAQADVLLHRGGAPRRRGATRKTRSTAQPRKGRGLVATSMRTTALLSTAWSRARGRTGAEAAAAVYAKSGSANV